MNTNNLENTINTLTELSFTDQKLNNASTNAHALMKSISSGIQSINSKNEVKGLIALYKADSTVTEYSVKIDEVIGELNNSIESSKDLLESFEQTIKLLEYQVTKLNLNNDPNFSGVIAVNKLKKHNIHNQIEIAEQTLAHLENWKQVGMSGLSVASDLTFTCDPMFKSTALTEGFKTINSNYLNKSRIALYFSYGFIGIFLLGSLILFIADKVLFLQFYLKIYFFTFFIIILTTLFLHYGSIKSLSRAQPANKKRNKDYRSIFMAGLIALLILKLLNFSTPLIEESSFPFYSFFCVLSWTAITTSLTFKNYFEYKRHQSYFEISDALHKPRLRN